MRVVGVSRVMDEADIIEPFMRHHAALLDLHIVLDNGSSDATVGIVRALHAEALPIQLYQTRSPIFLEQAYNTGLYRLALAAGADWVLFLDADELLVVRGAARPHAALALVPSDVAGLRLHAYRYQRPPSDAGHAFAGLRRRAREPEMPKIALRRLDPARVEVYAGNHFAFVDGVEEGGLSQDRLAIAHVPDRSALQLARKTILGRLKAIASGEAAAAHFITHRAADYAALKADARAWLERADAELPADLTDDPVVYRGGPLRHTPPADELARLVSVFAAQAEQLARSHGAILDRKRLVRRELQRQGAEIIRLL